MQKNYHSDYLSWMDLLITIDEHGIVEVGQYIGIVGHSSGIKIWSVHIVVVTLTTTTSC